MQSSWYQHVLKDAEDVALVLALATLGATQTLSIVVSLFILIR
jgi:hypothetical protein